MKFLKAISTAALALTLVACSSAPSDADVQAVTQQSLQQVDQQLAPLGLRWSDVFDTQVKVKNKAKQEDGRWLIEAETTVTAKKDLKELPETAQILVFAFAGEMKKGQAIGKSQANVLDGKSIQVTAVAKSDFNIIQKIDANNSKHIKVTTNQVQAPVNSSDKVGTATFEDKSLVGEGYLPNQGMPSMELVAGKEVKKSFFLKVWWNHFVNFVNEKL